MEILRGIESGKLKQTGVIHYGHEWSREIIANHLAEARARGFKVVYIAGGAALYR